MANEHILSVDGLGQTTSSAAGGVRVTTFISWRRLIDEYLRGELRSGERIERVDVHGHGISVAITPDRGDA